MQNPEQKPEPVELSEQSGEQLSLLMQQQYETILQCQQNIRNINAEVDARLHRKEPENG